MSTSDESLRREAPAPEGVASNYSKDIECKMMEVADLIAATLDQPLDPRAWDHLLIYAPREALDRRLSTLNHGENHDAVLASYRPDDEVRERHVDRGRPEPRNANQVANEQSGNAPVRMEVLGGGNQGIGRPDAGGGVRVKPLEWLDHRPDAFPEPAWSAQTPFGFYNIEEVLASDSPAYVVRLHAHHFVADKDDLEDAKAAAHADYERRILSALSTPPAAVESNGSVEARLREALEHYAKEYCEGWCEQDAGCANFDHDCGGCLARRALSAVGDEAKESESGLVREEIQRLNEQHETISAYEDEFLSSDPTADRREIVAREHPIQVAQRGFDVWAAKEHNKKWFKRIDGTPIPNDLVVCIAMEFAALDGGAGA